MGPGLNEWSVILNGSNEIYELEALVNGWYLINYDTTIDFGQNGTNGKTRASLTLTINNNEITGSTTITDVEVKDVVNVSKSLLVEVNKNDKISFLFWCSDVQINIGTNGNDIGKLPNTNTKPNETTTSITITRIA